MAAPPGPHRRRDVVSEPGSVGPVLSCANILTQQADVQTEMVALKKTLSGIYDQDVKPNL
jgi:hypothetical protein